MILYIDTTTDKLTMKLIKNGKIIDVLKSISEKNHSEQLLLQIDQILSVNSNTINDLLGIVVVNSGGSYTGLRVGVASANAIAYAKNLPIEGIPAESSDQKIINLALKISQKTGFGRSVTPKYPSPPKITKKI